MWVLVIHKQEFFNSICGTEWTIKMAVLSLLKTISPSLPKLRSVVRVGVFLLFLAFPLSDLQGSSHKGGQRTNTRLRLLWRKQIMKQSAMMLSLLPLLWHQYYLLNENWFIMGISIAMSHFVFIVQVLVSNVYLHT